MGQVLDFLRRVAPLRLVLMLIVQLAALIGVQVLHVLVFAKYTSPVADELLTLGACVGLLGVYSGLVLVFESRQPGELSLRPGVRWAGLGLVLGFGLFVAVYAVLSVAGVAAWAGFQGFSGVPPMLLMAVMSGIGEELAIRGVLFRVVEDSVGTTAALVVSAVIFGLLHAVNPGATVLSTVAIVLEAGVMLAAAYAWSRNLWLPIGLHFAWNFTEGGVFGAAVSGGAGKGVFAVALSPHASALVTGGTFGPEASLVAVVLGVVLAAVFIIAARRSGHWRPPTWRMMLA
jgi:membrane protease YdiL (CAAX protease family)